jgi:hypothetical protein
MFGPLQAIAQLWRRGLETAGPARGATKGRGRIVHDNVDIHLAWRGRWAPAGRGRVFIGAAPGAHLCALVQADRGSVRHGLECFRLIREDGRVQPCDVLLVSEESRVSLLDLDSGPAEGREVMLTASLTGGVGDEFLIQLSRFGPGSSGRPEEVAVVACLGLGDGCEHVFDRLNEAGTVRETEVGRLVAGCARDLRASEHA